MFTRTKWAADNSLLSYELGSYRPHGKFSSPMS